ncbi:hypothetical protein PQR34_22700 [Paraburkholderia sediminicola]|uniref:hypothetical protein n=1 Tax=Paraburkholderia TaxID=1822464 RepID=UPI00117F6D53
MSMVRFRPRPPGFSPRKSQDSWGFSFSDGIRGGMAYSPLRQGVLGGIGHGVIKSRQFKDLHASARSVLHWRVTAPNTSFRILKLRFLRALRQHGKAATGAEPFARRLTV